MSETKAQLARFGWQRSRRCESGGCVEVALSPDRVFIRDSKHSGGPVLEFTRQEWRAFVGGVLDGDFHLD